MLRFLAFACLGLTHSIALAFQGYDECGALEAALTEQQFELELDEPFERVTKSHGIRYTFGDDSERLLHPVISFVHPSFFSDDDDRDAYQKQAEIGQKPIIAINGLDASDLTETV